MSKFKKESGAQGRKRHAADAAECRKESAHFLSFFTALSTKAAKNDKDEEVGLIGSDTDTKRSDTEEEQQSKVEFAVEEVHNDDDIPPLLAFHDVGYLIFDPVTRESVIPNSVRREMLARGSVAFQNKDCQFPVTNGRSMQATWFTKWLTNGSNVNRWWLLYSPMKDAAYCFACLLFSTAAANVRSAFELEGFRKWKKSEKILLHESSVSYREAFGM